MPPPPRKTPPLIADDTGDAAPTSPVAGPVDPNFPFLRPPTRPGDLGELGPYRILSLLGQGGMGVVFRAEDPALKRFLALKVILPKAGSSDAAKARFVREARAAAAVEHDHVIPIHQIAEDAGVLFLAMPLLRGMSLAQALSGGKPPVAEAVRIGREIADGLAAAHEQGLIHRDIKPGNIWLEGSKRRVKILDFGLARAAVDTDPDGEDASFDPMTADLTRTGALIGTPSYMSPEQARAEPTDHRADLFSLGVVLYQMLAGRKPFVGTPAEVMTALTTADPPPLPAEVPTELRNLVRRLMAKRASDRPATAAAVEAELRRMEANLSAVVVPLGPADPWAELDATTTDSATFSRAAERSLRSEAKRGGANGVWWLTGAAVLVALAVGGFAVLKLERKPVVEATKPTPVPIAPPPPTKAKPTVPVLPETAADKKERAAAEVLHRWTNLTVAVAGGPDQDIGPGQPLPQGPIAVQRVRTGADDIGLPADREPFFAALAELREPKEIADWGNIYRLTPADLVRIRGMSWGGGVEALNVPKVLVTAELIDALAKFERLQVAGIDGGTADDAALARLAEKLPKLITLFVNPAPAGRQAGFTAAGVRSLAQLPLTNLRLEVALPAGDAALWRAVAGMPTLRAVTANLTGPGAADWAAVIVGSRSLTAAEVCGEVGDGDLDALAGLPGLAKLTLTRTRMTAAGAKALAAKLPGCDVKWGDVMVATAAPAGFVDDRVAVETLHPLATLNLRRPDRTVVADLPPEQPLPAGPLSVTRIELEKVLDPATRAAFFAALPTLRNLESMTDHHFLNGLAFRSADLPRLTTGNPAAVTALGLGRWAPTDAELDALAARFPGLNAVGFDGSGFDDARTERLAGRFPGLISLNLSATAPPPLTARGTAALAGLPLAFLELSLPSTDPAVVRPLAAAPKLAALRLKVRGPDPAGVLDELRGFRPLRSLYLNAAVTDAHVPALLRLDGLTALELWGDKLTDAGVARLAAARPKAWLTHGGRLVPPVVADERPQAEKLHAHFILAVRLPSGEVRRNIYPTDRLPPGRLTVETISLSGREPVPAEVRDLFFDTVPELRRFYGLHDWFGALRLTPADLTRLATGRGTDRLYSLVVPTLPADAELLTALTKFPALTALGVSADDAFLIALPERLPAITDLHVLDRVPGRRPTAVGLANVARLPLTNLMLGIQLSPTDAGVWRVVAGMPKLRRLLVFFKGTGVAGWADTLAVAPGLRELEIVGTFTDADLPDLDKLPRLTSVWVRSTQVTPAALADLAARRPECKVYRNDELVRPPGGK